MRMSYIFDAETWVNPQNVELVRIVHGTGLNRTYVVEIVVGEHSIYTKSVPTLDEAEGMMGGIVIALTNALQDAFHG